MISFLSILQHKAYKSIYYTLLLPKFFKCCALLAKRSCAKNFKISIFKTIYIKLN